MENHCGVNNETNCQSVDVQCPNCQSTFPLQNNTVSAISLDTKQKREMVRPREKSPSGNINRTVHEQRKPPREGDRVVAMCNTMKWTYFEAIVNRFDAEPMEYIVKWLHDEGDNCNIPVEDIALDDIVEDNTIGVGTQVLFRQGVYTLYHSIPRRSRGVRRWHQGIITHVHRNKDGYKTYSGHHTKTELDGKSIKYQHYSYHFHHLSKFDFRLAPNILDVLYMSEAEHTSIVDTDIYISYSMIDSACEIEVHKVGSDEIPESYLKFGYQKMCDPVHIEEFLKSEGFSVNKQVSTNRGNYNVKTAACMIKRSKIFIACLSDSYVANSNCRMEFQHAKVSLKKPVIPLVVGDGSFKWITSVVGMLIAGELFIHFRDKDVELDKNTELLMNIRNHIPKAVSGKEVFSHTGKTQWNDEVDYPGGTPKRTTTKKRTKIPPEIFLSYCWSNSHLAHQAKQIESLHGSTLSDPRLLKKKLEEAGYVVWMDIERLESANAGAGLYEQIVQGVKSSLLVIPCVSDEYALSRNCTMEFQFSVKSLSKPVIPVVVGGGDDWKRSVIGCFLSINDKEPINIQNIKNHDDLDQKVGQILREVEAVIGKPRKAIKRKAAKARSYDIVRNSKVLTSSSSSESSTDSDDDKKDESKEGTPEKIKPSSLDSVPQRLRAPKIEDRVIGHYTNSLFSTARVVGLSVRTMTYTLDWDKNELEEVSVVPYDQVALDQPPERDDIGIGMEVLFPEGRFPCKSCGECHLRYFEGEITNISDGKEEQDGNFSTALVSGIKVKASFKVDPQDQSASMHYFENISIRDIRLPPTAFDFLEMCLYEWDGGVEEKKTMSPFQRNSSTFN